MPTIPHPPPLPPTAEITFNKRNSIDQKSNNKLELNECLWAVGDPDVQRSCFFARTCRTASPKECVYLVVDPILQTGEIQFISN
jgi:hypothetical protein